MPKLSIIIVSWNAKDFLRNCLASIHAHTPPLVGEVIVVDNASTDGSPDMVAREFPDTIVIRSPRNLGFAGGNNLGLKHASFPYLALVNSDVVVPPGCFETLVDYLEAHRDVGLVGPKIVGGDGELQLTCRRFPTLWNTTCRALALDRPLAHWSLFSGRELPPMSHDQEQEVEVLSGCFWIARRAAVEGVGGLDERFFFYAEDVDWCKRFWDKGWKVTFVPQAIATHYGGGSSENAPLRYSIELMRANIAYWRKHKGVFGKAFFYGISVLHHSLRLVLRGGAALFFNDITKESAFKFKRSQVCLRWLITGKEG